MATANKGLVLDASAIIACIEEEPPAQSVYSLLREADWSAVGAPTLLEASMVLASRSLLSSLDKWLEALQPTVLPFTHDHYLIAFDVFTQHGKGRSPARLNYGDCMAYATASLAQAPLLYVGNDFDLTGLNCVKAE